MRMLRVAIGLTMSGATVVVVACGHDEPPPTTPSVPTSTATVQAVAQPVPKTSATVTPNLTAPWGRDVSLGDDPLSARGNMWGEAIGDAGEGEGIGLGNIGTLGHGAGTGTGQGFGTRDGGARTTGPSLRQGATQVTGRLAPEVVQRIVRQNFGRFRLCYENGLRSEANLQGRISVTFVISDKGDVSSTKDSGSDLPDKSVVSCVVRGFSNLTFPAPESGTVTVVYPILFSPGDATPAKKK